MYPNAKPPIKAPINPLPPITSAIRNVSIAIAKNAILWYSGVIHSLSRAFKTNQPPASPTTRPTNIPKPICWKATWIKYTEGSKASAAKPMAIKTRRKGTEPPSFNPLSISMVLLILSGTFLF